MVEHCNSDSEKHTLTKLRQAIPKSLILQVRQKSLLVILIPWLFLVLFYASPEQIRFSNLDTDKHIANLIWQLPLAAYAVLLLFASPRERLTMLLLPPITLLLAIGLLGFTQGSITLSLQTAFASLTSTNLKLVASKPADDNWLSNTYSYVLPSHSPERICRREEKRLTSELLQVRILNRLEYP